MCTHFSHYPVHLLPQIAIFSWSSNLKIVVIIQVDVQERTDQSVPTSKRTFNKSFRTIFSFMPTNSSMSQVHERYRLASQSRLSAVSHTKVSAASAG